MLDVTKILPDDNLTDSEPSWVVRVPYERTHPHLYEIFGADFLIETALACSLINIRLSMAARRLQALCCS
jgi:hypothetical protein